MAEEKSKSVKKKKSLGRRIFGWTWKILLGLLILLILLILSLRIPAVQNFAKDKAIHYLEDKIGTKVELEKIYIGFPETLQIEKLYLQGEDVDTLLSVRDFRVGLNMKNLISNKVTINSVNLEGTRANVIRDKDGKFNFDYIIDAFATEDEKDETSKPWIISLDKIKLKDIGVSFVDHQSANDINVYFKSFDTSVKTFDLDENNYAVNDINMDGLRLKLKQDLVEEVAKKTKEVTPDTDVKPLKLKLKGINLTNFDIDYGDENSKTFAQVKFGELSTQIKNLNLDDMAYEIGKTKLKDAEINANLALESSEKNDDADSSVEENNPLKLFLGSLELDNVKVVYNNTNAGYQSQGMDFNHLDFSKLDLKLEEFKMEDGTFAGKVKSAEISEKSGLEIQKFQTDFVYQQNTAYLKKLYLETPQTLLRDEVVLNYDNINQLTENPGNVHIVANIEKSKIGFRDILTLVPDLRNTTPFDKYPNAILNIDTKLSGIINDLAIKKFELTGLDQTSVKVSGQIKNAMDPDLLWMDLKIPEFKTTSKTIYNLVPTGTVANNITLPQNIAANGTVKGGIKDILADLKINTSFGNAIINADVDMQKENAERYRITANLQNLQIGKIIQNEEVGAMTGQVKVNGIGFDPNTLSANMNGNINSFDFGGYKYQNVALDGEMSGGDYEINLNSKDPNAELALTVNGRFSDDEMTIQAKGDIVKLDIHKLGFYEDPMILAGKIDVDFSNLDPDYLNGTLHLSNFEISDTQEILSLGDIDLKASSTSETNEIDLKSQIADFNLKGKYKLTEIADALMETVNQYYQLPGEKKEKNITAGQYFTFDGKIKNDELIQKFVPELTDFDDITLNGNFDADQKQLKLSGKIPKIIYGDFEIEDGKLDLKTEENQLDYNLDIQKAKNEQLQLDRIGLAGNLRDNIFSYELSTKDDKNKNQFLIAGKAKTLDDILEISLNQNGFMLDYDQWQVSPDNYIQVSPEGILAHNFVLSHDESKLSLNSETDLPNSPLNIEITHFRIERIAEILKQEDIPAKGIIEGKARIEDLKNNMQLSADLNVNGLELMGNPVGDILAVANNKTKEIIGATVNLTGNDNDVQLKGDYNMTESSFDFDLAVRQLQMKTAEAFSMGNLERTEGYLSGDLKIKGKADSSKILGKIDFNDVAIGITQTGSYFKDIDESITFNNEGINFKRFRLKDSEGNSLTLNGKILTDNYRDFAFDLNLRANDFRLVDSEEDINKLLYGVLAMDANLNIRGDLDLPKVDGTLTVTESTDITFVMPQSSPQLHAREGIVEFIDRDNIALKETIQQDSLTDQSRIKGMDVSVNIDIDRKATTSLLIDKVNGDLVKMQGNAELTGGIDPSGKITLVGVYEVEEGSYEMSLSLLKRKFDIQKGSTITWTGDPMSALIDLTAVYTTKAAPLDLLEQQLGEGETVNQYKQQIPFHTELIMKGELMKPEISFDITTDDTNNSVAAEVLDNTKTKLELLRTDTSEMNKQVFALLLLNRFIGEDPFHSETGVSAKTMVKQSVSRLLSEQLNNLAGDLIGGVDINFGLESTEDYSTGELNERTDLNVDISKKLLNDRLTVTVGSNFGVEGEARENEKMTNIAGNVALDYALSRDGRYKVRVYRKDEYQVALQGQIIETGVGFIITLDYDKFKEIFQRKRDRKQWNDKGRKRKNRELTGQKDEIEEK